ncbi:MAG: GldG family protein [Flavobacteriales bacterium]|nr:GldG family protein [Flavobacteriales bacterium]
MSRRAVPLITLLLLLVAAVFVNLLAQRHKFRLDLTGDKRYTLDRATLELIQGLPEAVTVTAYFTEDLPPELAVARQDFKDLLVEYAERSGGKLVFEFEDPGSSERIAAKAMQEGVRPLLAQTRQKDRSENIQVLMGAVVRMGERKSVIPALQEGPGMEWILSSAIAQVTRVEKPLIGVMQGHMEPSTQAVDELATLLNAQYDVEATRIYDSFPINERFTSLLVIDPKDSISAWHQRLIDDYMAKGHGVVMAFGAVETNLAVSPQASMRDIGIGPWLARHGIRIGPGLVVDEHCGQVGVMQSAIQQPISVQFPYYPLLEQFNEHPVAHGLDMVLFQFASPISFVGDSTKLRFSPILSTSARSGLKYTPLTIDLRKKWTDADFPLGPQVVGAAVEPVDTSAGRLVVFSNGNFCVGDQGGQRSALPKGNLDLMVNAVDWVTHNTELLSIRGKQRNYRPITDPGDAERTFLKWLNLLLPIALVLLYGLFRGQWRRHQRKRRMAPGHVR